MNTTLEQRLALYEQTLKSVIDNQTYFGECVKKYGLCFAIDLVKDQLELNLTAYSEYDIPEIIKFKPATLYDEERGYWFEKGDWKSRIKILEQAIEYTKQLIAQQ